MKIIADTREQKVLQFNHPFITEVVRKKLDAGDYAVEFSDGFSPAVVFERKSITDLFGTLGDGYARFKKEILRAKKANTTLIIIIEGTLTEVRQGIERSFRSGDTIISQLFTIRTRHGIETVFCDGREEAADFITQTFLSLGREYVRNKGRKCSLTEKSETQK